MKILITGFEPNDKGLNASKILVESLSSELTSSIEPSIAEFTFEILPPDTESVKSVLYKLIESHNTDICVFIGQAPGRNKIGLERIAINLKDFGAPDGKGNHPKGDLIEPEGSAAYWSSVKNQQDIVEVLNNKGIPAFLSNNGGYHLCNQVLYLGLQLADKSQSNMKCCFIHIPPLPEQVINQWPGSPFMELSTTKNAIVTIINEIIKNA